MTPPIRYAPRYDPCISPIGVNREQVSITHDQAAGFDLPSGELATVAADAIDRKQGHDIVILDVGDLLGIVDMFVIASGTSKRQVRTLAEEVDVTLERHSRSPLRREGMDTAEWVLLDYGDLAVHIFQPEARDFYSLERLWGDAPRMAWVPPVADSWAAAGNRWPRLGAPS